MTSHALDAGSWSTSTAGRVQKRARLGQSISRKKLLRQENPSVEIHPPVHEVMDTNRIVSVEFLDAHQTVLSADSYGRICVHRLPAGKSKLHKVLDLPPLQDQMTQVKLFPLSDGQSFCVGLPNGDYRVYSRGDQLCSGGGTRLAAIANNSDYQAHQIRGARRRYHRCFRNPLHSMNQQDPTIQQQQPQLSEISDWDAPNRRLTRPKSFDWLQNSPALPGRYPTVHEDARWAFRETPSTILAAYVDPELDCFTVMDNRVHRPVVYCHAPTTGKEEDITAACFLSDHALLTSHVWKKRPEQPDNGLKLWDIRMSTKPVVVVKDVLPSFPYDTMIRKRDPDMKWFVTEQDEGRSSIAPTPSLGGAPSRIHRITRLAAPCDGRAMITLQSQAGTEALLYDLIHNKIMFRHMEEAADLLTGAAPLVAISSSTSSDSSNNMICTAAKLPGAKTRLTIHDPSSVIKKNNVSRKRPITKEKPTLVGSTVFELEDREGLNTRLTSLAWNKSGTSLVGGSLDGDVFVWE